MEKDKRRQNQKKDQSEDNRRGHDRNKEVKQSRTEYNKTRYIQRGQDRREQN